MSNKSKKIKDFLWELFEDLFSIFFVSLLVTIILGIITLWGTSSWSILNSINDFWLRTDLPNIYILSIIIGMFIYFKRRLNRKKKNDTTIENN